MTNNMDKITDEMAEYICDELCGKLLDVPDQEHADNICNNCKMSSFLCRILNENAGKGSSLWED